MVSCLNSSNVRLMTAAVDVVGPNGKRKTVSAFIDQGAQASFVRQIWSVCWWLQRSRKWVIRYPFPLTARKTYKARPALFRPPTYERDSLLGDVTDSKSSRLPNRHSRLGLNSQKKSRLDTVFPCHQQKHPILPHSGYIRLVFWTFSKENSRHA